MTMNEDVYAIADLACRRYPDVPIAVALRYYASDRRAAGLGALDEQKRRGRGDVRRDKRVDILSGAIVYELGLHRISRYERDAPVLLSPRLVDAAAFSTTTFIPEVHLAFRLEVDERDLADQRERGRIARQLLDARRQLRKAQSKKAPLTP